MVLILYEKGIDFFNMATNRNMNKARKEKKVEFYTMLDDIAAELTSSDYLDYLKGKTVLCNCDDPEYSNFYKFFKDCVKSREINRLISTHYNKDNSISYKMEVFLQNGEVQEQKTFLNGNGDFRSDECIEILKECDVVCTNPPFNDLFHDFLAQLIKYDKKFIFLGDINSIAYKDVFPLLKDGKMWTGNTFNKVFYFNIPEYYVSNVRDSTGRKVAKKSGILWYTNIDIKKRHNDFEPNGMYLGHETKYPKYFNYDAINVNKVSDIPCDYYGVMGVPITFMGVYNPDQFALVGISSFDGPPMPKSIPSNEYVHGGPAFYIKLDMPDKKGHLYKRLYDRILIQRKK